MRYLLERGVKLFKVFPHSLTLDLHRTIPFPHDYPQVSGGPSDTKICAFFGNKKTV